MLKEKENINFPKDRCVHDLIEQQAKQKPDSIALIFGDHQLTYAELNTRANQLAHHLVSMGAEREALVAICLERSIEMIIGLLAILKSGAAYVPIDPLYPDERKAFMLSDTNSTILLTQQHLVNQLPKTDATVICLDADSKDFAQYPTTTPVTKVNPNNLIYTIYTSGSTGKPKGVQIEHRNVINLVEGQLNFVQHPVKRFLYAYSFAFDGAVLLIYWTLLDGATLVMAPEGLEKDINHFASFIEQHEISHLLTFPSLYSILLEQANPHQLCSLESVSVAGEACPGAMVIKHHQTLSHVKLLNQYGPTEGTVGASIYITPTNFKGTKVPIGKTINNVQIYILDEQLNEVAVGETGEIYIGGNGVARGYLNRPKLTKERFIDNPFGDGKIYKTGDLAQFLPDGNIDFIGRADYQVKLRGYRIELGEIEAVLTQHELIREAVVKIIGTAAADQKLIAYIVTKDNTTLNTSELKTFLGNLIPEYMIPSVFLFLDKMPLAASGKVDRKALPDPGRDRPTLEQPYVAPQTDLEKHLTNLWSDILGIDQIGINDKFFELGGNSLQAAKFITTLQEQLEETIFIVTIFDTPTIAEYAAMLEKDYATAVNKYFGNPTGQNQENNSSSTKLSAEQFDRFHNFVPKLIPNFKKDQKKNPPAIFILAPPRSGTTLLRVMLAGHPDLFAANELQLLGFNTLKEREIAYSGKFRLWQEGAIRAIMEIQKCDADKAKAILQDLLEKNYTTKQVYALLQSWIGNKTLVDKSPSYVLDPAILQKAEHDFENAIFIHLVRHPYAMIRSFERMHMDQVMYLNKHDHTTREVGELIWTESHRITENFLKDIPEHRQFRIIYEDLVQNPKAIMEAMCQQLNIPYHPNLINPYQDINKKMTDGIYSDSKPMGDVKLLQHKQINPQLAASWEGVEKDNFLSDTTWEVAQKMGYKNPAKEEIQKTQNKDLTTFSNQDIAIVGMSGRFPGAKNIDEFWDNLVTGKDVSVQFTPEELIASGLDPNLLKDPDYVNRGMPLDDYDCFDAGFFGYLPKEAALMDPQHRIFLECAYAALEDAGYDSDRFNGDIGVYGGVARNTYLVNNVITHPNYFKSVDDFMLGITLEKDFPSTRVAYKMNLKGPAVNVQTACSSSGVAVHLACQSLMTGDADMALVGGGRIQPPVLSGHLHKEGHALSPDGYCHTFDADAQGMVRGNGMAFIVIKRLNDAIKDGDSIHAVIKSTAINNDGADKIGFTAPSIKGQSTAIKKAYEKAGINPETISYIEAHGTGTAIGDPIEIAGLTKAFQHFTNKKNFCAVGSVKTNIGHLDAGACVAGIIKTTLALKYQQLPASLHFKKPNPQIDFEKTPFFVNNKLRDWKKGDTPRRAGISSFGLGGTNAHIVLEEAPDSNIIPTNEAFQLLTLSAKSEKALTEMSANLGQYLADKNPDITDAAFTLQQGRKQFKHRRILVAKTSKEAATILINNDRSKLFSNTVQSNNGKVVFMFPGGGAQHSNMALGLYTNEPVFKNAVDQCLQILKDIHGLDLKDILYPSQNTTELKPIENPLHGITLLFTIEYATAQLWMSWGIQPTELIGHSLGEYTAACIAGVLSLEDTMAMVAKRGQLFQTLPEGGMLSIPLPYQEVEKMMDNDLSFAAINKPDQCVVSGKTAAIDRMKQQLNALEIHSTRLHIKVAAHSNEVAPILDEFATLLQTITYNEPQIPIVSNVTGTWVNPQEIQHPDYWIKHLRQTVKFSDGIEAIFSLSERFLLEIGPGQTLCTFSRQHPTKPSKQLILASLKHPKEKTDDWAFILKSLGQLWLSGIDIDWVAFAAHQENQRISLPHYPFERTRFWIEPKVNNDITTQETNGTMNKFDTSGGSGDTTPSIHQKDLVIRDLKEVFHQLSGIATDSMEEHATFLELGFDSLFLTQAVSKIKKQFKIKLSFRQLFEEAPSIYALGEYIDERIDDNIYKDELLKLNTVQNNTTAPKTQTTHAPSIVQNQAPTNTTIDITPTTPLPPEQAGTVQGIINQQLSLMQQQLALLAGQKIVVQENPSTPIATPNNHIETNSTPNLNGVDKKITAKPSENGLATKDAQSVKRGDGKKHGPWRPIDKKNEDGLTDQQVKYLKEFTEYYTTRTKGSQTLITKQRPKYADPRSISGFNKLWKDMVYQIAVDRSKGSKLWDVDGNEYVDYVMAFGISLFGHTPDFIQKAVSQQLEKGIELGVLNPLANKVADLLAELSGMDRVTFVNTGSESLSAAVRAARTVTFKDKIIVFEGDYHGIADEFLARSVKRNGKYISMPVSPGIPTSLMENIIVLNYDDPNIIEFIEENGDDLAAVMIEPLQPMNPHLQRKELFHKIRKVTADNNIALIFDEMITGFRVAPRGAQEWFDIEADMVCYGKIISGGLPMAALAGKSVYLDAFDGGMWQFGDQSVPEAGVTFFGGTFVKHPLSMASAYAALTEIKKQGQDFYDALNAKTARFAERVKALFIKTKVPLLIQSSASVFAIKVTDDNPLSRLFFFYLRAKGVHLTERAGLVSGAHTEEDLDFTYNVIEEIIREMQTAGFFKLSVDEVEDKNIIIYPPHIKVEKKNIPLTEGQKEVWVEQRLGNEAAAAYNLSSDILLKGELDIEQLTIAIQTLVNRHEALRATFNFEETTQNIAAERKINLAIIDLSTLNDTEKHDALEQLRHEESETPLDIFKGPLFRTKLIKLAKEEHRLFMTVHHGIADGWSVGILANDLSKLYTAAANGASANLSTPTQLSDYAIAQQNLKKSEEGLEAEAYWVEQFKDGVPVLEFPTDRSRPAAKTYAAAMEKINLDRDLMQQLKQVATKQSTTLFILMYAAYQSFLQRLSKQDDMVLGLVAAGQSIAGYENLVAHGVSLLPVRIKNDLNESFSAHLKNVRNTVLDGFEHQNYTLGSLVKKLKLPRDPSRQPIISFLFNMDSEMGELAFGNLEVKLQPIPRNYETFDTFINVKPSANGIDFEWIYNTDLFNSETIERRLQEFEVFLKGIVDNPDTSISKLALLPSEEQQLLASWNNTQASYPQNICIHQLIEQQVDKTPYHTALVFKNEEYSYNQLNEKSNQLAHHLSKAGVQKGDFVGIYLDRSAEMLISILATSKIGAIYVPLDPSNPADRLQVIIEDAQAKYIITHEKLINSIPDKQAQVFCFEQLTLSNEPKHNPQLDIQATDIVYVNYTSGSSGKPKGVLIPHYAVIDHHYAIKDAIPLTEDDVIFAVASIAFDPSVQDFFLPLFVGAKVVIASQSIKSDGFLLKERLNATKATLMQATPSTWRMLLSAGWEGSDQLTILSGGEGLTKELADKLIAKSKSLYNIYGPTETTIWSTLMKLEGDRMATKMETGYEPVGKPINNVQIFLLDEHLQQVPIGVAGEIYVGGVGVAPGGYFKRDELTTEKFVENPFDYSSKKLYRTGDMARYLANGDLEYLNRADNQVKIRGFRIELGEIESAIAQHDSIKENVVIIREDQEDNKILVAYLVLKDDYDLDRSAFKQFLRKKLPDYMVPSAFVPMEQFPLTATMKIDRKKMPIPELTRDELETGYMAARTDNEKLLVRIWEKLLGIPQIGIHDNFFELGGHSLIAVKLMAAIELETEKKLPLAVLLENPTIKLLARLLEADAPISGMGSFVPIKASGNKTPLYILPGAGLHVLLFQTLAQHMDKEQPIYALQAKGLNGEDEPLDSIDAMADHFINEMLKHTPSEAYALSGYSFGGLIAFEMTKKLRAMGKKVIILSMFDTVIRPEITSESDNKNLSNKFKKVAWNLGNIAKNPLANIKYKSHLFQRRYNGKKVLHTFINGKITNAKEDFSDKVEEKNRIAFEKYRIQPQDIKVHLFRAVEQRFYIEDFEYLGWKPYALDGVEVHKVAGDHLTMFDAPHGKQLATVLQKCIDDAEKAEGITRNNCTL